MLFYTVERTNICLMCTEYGRRVVAALKLGFLDFSGFIYSEINNTKVIKIPKLNMRGHIQLTSGRPRLVDRTVVGLKFLIIRFHYTYCSPP